MRYLVAPHRPAVRDDDTVRTVSGELLMLGIPCTRTGCACTRSWVGMGSRAFTTLATVADVDQDIDDLAALARQITADVLGFDLGHEIAADSIRTIAEHAAARDLGATVRMDDWEAP